MQTLQQRLETRGWRMTAQRRAIASTLCGDNLHLTADEVFARARNVLPEISLATVYNCLTELVEMGEVGQVITGRGPTRYDPNVMQPHHHAVCTLCGAIHDVPLAPETQAVLKHAGETSLDARFTVGSADVLFRGVCAGCGPQRHEGAAS